MKFYVSGELNEEIFGEDVLEHCKKCPNCYLENDGSHSCVLSNEYFNIEDEITYGDETLECWLP